MKKRSASLQILQGSNKRAISTIIATVLIILITVAGVAIIWIGILPMVKDNLGNINTDVDLRIVSSLGYTVWDSENRLATVQVKRGNDESDIIGFDLIFNLGGNSVKHYVDAVLEINNMKVYYVNLSGHSGDLSSISVAPVFRGGLIGEVMGKLGAEKIPDADVLDLISSGKISEEFVVANEGFDEGDFDDGSCLTCTDCDGWFGGCDYAKCHSCELSGDCYYRGIVVGDNCVDLDYACSDLVGVCSDYSSEECGADRCNLNCSWDGDSCEEDCVADCSGKVCGDDGCGGSCGSCGVGESCVGGVCVESPVGEVYYVSVTGFGIHDGSVGNEFNLSEAQSYSNENPDVEITFLLGSGEYGDFSEVDVFHTNWITYKANTGHTPIFSSISVRKISYGGELNAYLIFKGITIYHGGAYIRSVNHVKLYNCTFIGEGCTETRTNTVSRAILLHTIDDLIIDGCTITGDGDGDVGYTSVSGIPNDGFSIAYNFGILFEAPCTNVTINDCDIGGCNTGISGITQSGITVSNCYVHHAAGDFITVNTCNTDASGLTDPIVIEYNHLYAGYEYPATLEEPNIGWHNDGIQFNDVEINHAIIRGNRIHYTDGDAMFLRGDRWTTGNSNWLIENNLIYDTVRAPIIADTQYTINMYNCDDIVFRNNTVMGKGRVEAASDDTFPAIITNFSNNILNKVGFNTAIQNVVITYENNNIINTVLYGMEGFDWGSKTLILNNDIAFQNLFYDYVNGNFSPIMNNYACNGSVNSLGVAVGALTCVPECSNGQTQLCSNQIGVCAGCLEICMGGHWLGCDNSTYLSCDNNYESPETSCSDTYDNDCDGCVNSVDSDCGGTETSCSDTYDNDCDGQIDCSDSDCLEDSACQPPEDYVSYWKFEGNVDDETGTNNGALMGSASIIIDARGNVLSLSGGTDYVDIPNPSQLSMGEGNWTATAWFRMDTYVEYSGIVVFDGDGIVFNNNRVAFLLDSSVVRYASSDTPVGAYVHAAITRSGTTYKVYVNGEDVTATRSDGGWGLSGKYRIGMGLTNYNFNGTIDDVMIFNRSLSGDEVLEIYCGQGGDC